MVLRIIVTILLSTGPATQAIAQIPHIFGSWALNTDESVYPGPLPRSQVRTYFPLEDEFYVGVMVTIDAGGRASFLQYTAKPDGGDYPEHDVITLAQQQMSNRKTPNTYSESRIDEYTVAWADKRDGETYVSGTKRVTADGMQLIIDFSAPDADGEVVDYSLVYDKQSP